MNQNDTALPVFFIVDKLVNNIGVMIAEKNKLSAFMKDLDKTIKEYQKSMAEAKANESELAFLFLNTPKQDEFLREVIFQQEKLAVHIQRSIQTALNKLISVRDRTKDRIRLLHTLIDLVSANKAKAEFKGHDGVWLSKKLFEYIKLTFYPNYSGLTNIHIKIAVMGLLMFNQSFKLNELTRRECKMLFRVSFKMNQIQKLKAEHRRKHRKQRIEQIKKFLGVIDSCKDELYNSPQQETTGE